MRRSIRSPSLASRRRTSPRQGGSLLSGQTSGSGVIKSGGESSLGSGHVLGIGNISGGDLSGLGVRVDGRQGGVLPSLSGGEGGVKDGLSLLDLSGVLNGESGGSSQSRGDQQFVHFVGDVQR